MDDPQSFLQLEISDDEKLQLLPSLKTWKEGMEKRDSARSDFQSKMAVLCSGSIAVLASGALAVVNSTAAPSTFCDLRNCCG
jgi:hypothetical protein